MTVQSWNGPDHMNPLDFCYWLQGYFQLAPRPTLKEKQIIIINKNLELALDKKGSDLEATYFCYWLQGIFYASDCITFDKKDVTNIQDRLQNVFEQVECIDVSNGANWKMNDTFLDAAISNASDTITR